MCGCYTRTRRASPPPPGLIIAPLKRTSTFTCILSVHPISLHCGYFVHSACIIISYLLFLLHCGGLHFLPLLYGHGEHLRLRLAIRHKTSPCCCTFCLAVAPRHTTLPCCCTSSRDITFAPVHVTVPGFALLCNFARAVARTRRASPPPPSLHALLLGGLHHIAQRSILRPFEPLLLVG